jgi:hypothetical protein
MDHPKTLTFRTRGPGLVRVSVRVRRNSGSIRTSGGTAGQPANQAPNASDRGLYRIIPELIQDCHDKDTRRYHSETHGITGERNQVQHNPPVVASLSSSHERSSGEPLQVPFIQISGYYRNHASGGRRPNGT